MSAGPHTSQVKADLPPHHRCGRTLVACLQVHTRLPDYALLTATATLSRLDLVVTYLCTEEAAGACARRLCTARPGSSADLEEEEKSWNEAMDCTHTPSIGSPALSSLVIRMVREQALSWAARVRGTKPESLGNGGEAAAPSGKLPRVLDLDDLSLLSRLPSTHVLALGIGKPVPAAKGASPNSAAAAESNAHADAALRAEPAGARANGSVSSSVVFDEEPDWAANGVAKAAPEPDAPAEPDTAAKAAPGTSATANGEERTAGGFDLRSDTVTRPTPEMRRAMAEVGELLPKQ